jgi:hypothetical protein
VRKCPAKRRVFTAATGAGSPKSSACVKIAVWSLVSELELTVCFAESYTKNAVLQINGSAAGRPCEVATLSTDVLTWEPLLECGVATWYQIKTHKDKIIALSAGPHKHLSCSCDHSAGADRYLCVLNALASAFAAGCFKDDIYEPTELNYLFTSLAASKSVTTVR